MTTTPPRIDPRLGAAALRAPAASMVDSRPQAILKLQPCNSFDYRVRYEPQLNYHIKSTYKMCFRDWCKKKRTGLDLAMKMDAFSIF